MIGSISLGDEMKCLFCREPFVLEKIDFDSQAEYIKCPHCQKSTDIHNYHRDLFLSPQMRKAQELTREFIEKYKGGLTLENSFDLFEKEYPGVLESVARSLCNYAKW